MSDVIIITGPPGPGKTAVARLLARRSQRSAYLHTDDFWHVIAQGSIPPYLPESDQQDQTVVQVTAEAAFGSPEQAMEFRATGGEMRPRPRAAAIDLGPAYEGPIR